MNNRLTRNKKNSYNRGIPVRCDCGQIIAFKKNGQLMLYCKHCKQQIPFRYEPEPSSLSHHDFS